MMQPADLKKIAVEQDIQGQGIENPTSLLELVSRSKIREGVQTLSAKVLPFAGADIYNGHELSWLNKQGKPLVALLTWVIPCQSTHVLVLESVQKYLNGFAFLQFSSSEEVEAQIQTDMSAAIGSHVAVALTTYDDVDEAKLYPSLEGIVLDRLYIDMDDYDGANPAYLKLIDEEQVPHKEVLVSDLLCCRSPQTYDFLRASIQVSYIGSPIEHAGLLRYLVSYRNMVLEAQTCVERIYMDLLKYCQPQRLRVYACYGRRHGVNLNIQRSSAPEGMPSMHRLARQ